MWNLRKKYESTHKKMVGYIEIGCRKNKELCKYLKDIY